MLVNFHGTSYEQKLCQVASLQGNSAYIVALRRLTRLRQDRQVYHLRYHQDQMCLTAATATVRTTAPRVFLREYVPSIIRRKKRTPTRHSHPGKKLL